MLLADKIQLIILVVLTITAIIALIEIHSTKEIHRDSLRWNIKNRTYNTLGDFRQLRPNLTREKFKDILEVPGTEIPLERILEAIKENPEIRTEIIEYLNHHEGIANGIKNNLLDEKMVHDTRRTTFRTTYNEFKKYIEYRRNISSPTAWEEYEALLKKWNASA